MSRTVVDPMLYNALLENRELIEKFKKLKKGYLDEKEKCEKIQSNNIILCKKIKDLEDEVSKAKSANFTKITKTSVPEISSFNTLTIDPLDHRVSALTESLNIDDTELPPELICYNYLLFLYFLKIE